MAKEPFSDPEKDLPSSFKGVLSQYTFEATSTPSPASCMTRTSHTSQTLSPAHSAASKRKAPSSTNSPSRAKRLRPPPNSDSPSRTISASPVKRKVSSASYAPPSKYAHLTNLLTDSLGPDLICIFVGLNPGLRTATTGHSYAHPSNLFWKLSYSSGCTPRLCKPSECHDLPRLYSLGHTNLVSRTTKDASELSKAEMDEGVAVLDEKVRVWRPEAVAIVGKSIWESIWRTRHSRGITKAEFKYGWQDEGERMGIVRDAKAEKDWPGARVFVATTTSGLAAGMRPHEKEEIWRGLGDWVKRRRREKNIPDEGRARGLEGGLKDKT